LRTTELAILYGDFQFHEVEDNIMAYSRAYFDQQAIVIFNKNNTRKEVVLELRDGFDYFKLVNHFGNHFLVDGNTLTISMEPNTFEILTL